MRRLSQPGDILVAELASVLLEDQRSGGLIGQGEGDGRVKAAGRREEKEVGGEGKRRGRRLMREEKREGEDKGIQYTKNIEDLCSKSNGATRKVHVSI